LLDTINGFVGADLGHAVAWSSWERSGCEQKCCFTINGGLHTSSKDAPSETESLPIPIWYHAIEFDSPLSRRTCVAAVVSLDTYYEMATRLMWFLGFKQKDNKRICKYVEMAMQHELLVGCEQKKNKKIC
jgi:hypothetical protein